MPLKDFGTSQLLFKSEDGEYKTIGEPVEISEIPEMSKDIKGEYLPKISGELEMSIPLMESAIVEITRLMKELIAIDILKKLREKANCNNWRKMHRIPMIRRSRKRK